MISEKCIRCYQTDYIDNDGNITSEGIMYIIFQGGEL